MPPTQEVAPFDHDEMRLALSHDLVAAGTAAPALRREIDVDVLDPGPRRHCAARRRERLGLAAITGGSMTPGHASIIPAPR